MKYLLLLLLGTFLITIVSAQIQIGIVGDKPYVNSEQVTTSAVVNYSLIPTVNSSEYADIWITTEGNKDDVSDITYDEISGGDVNAAGYTGYFSFLSGTVGGIDMTGDPWWLSGTDVELERELTVNGYSHLNNTYPLQTLTYELGSGALRWLKLWVANISAEYIDTYNMYVSENLTVSSNRICNSTACFTFQELNATGGGNPFDQWVNTTSDVRVNNLTIDNRLIVNSTTSLYTCPTPTGSFSASGYEDPSGEYYAEGETYNFYVYGKCNYQGREFYSSGYLTIEWYDLDYITPMEKYYRHFDLTSVNKNGAPALRVLYANPSTVDRGYDLTGTSFYDYEYINPWSDSYINYSVSPQNATISNVTHIIKGNVNLTGTLVLQSEMDWFSFVTQGKKIFSARPWYNTLLNKYESEFFMENKSALLFSSDDGQLRIYPDNRIVGTPIERLYIETNLDNMIFSKLNYNTIPTVQFNALNTKINYLLQMTLNTAQPCSGLGDKGEMYYDYTTGNLLFCDGNTDNDWRELVWTDYTGNIIIPKTKPLYFSGSEGEYNSSINWDGTNLVFRTNLTRAGIAWFSNNISTTGIMTRSLVYDLTKGPALENIKDASLLVNPDGSINHSASPCYATYEVSDCENNFTIIENKIKTYCFFFYIDGVTRCIPEDRQDYHEAPDIVYKGTNYTITYEKICGTRIEEGVELECLGNIGMQSAVELKNKSSTLEQENINLQSQINGIKKCAKNSPDYKSYQLCVGGT